MDGPEPGSRGWLVWLDEPGLDRSTVGGKGESLNRLIALGAPVPAACAITAAAWREASDALGLPDRVDHLATSECERIRERILTAPLPAVIHASIAAAWRALEERVGPKPILAVRSSGVAEDSPARSFAGLHDTVLDVRSPGMLDAAVRQCWASLWSERAVAYRRDHDIAGDGDAMAVVIQQLVRSDISFVTFTRDPVTMQPDRLVISATWGLGEAVVSGLVHPDHVALDPDNNVVAYDIGVKRRMIIPAVDGNGGTREVPVPRAMQETPALSTEQAVGIARMARELACRLGYDADIEGGISDGAIHLFQARPITTLDVRVVVAHDDDRVQFVQH